VFYVCSPRLKHVLADRRRKELISKLAGRTYAGIKLVRLEQKQLIYSGR
jgi:hypothetical protein